MIGFLLFGLFIFLFILYLFAKDDYVLFRKNVTLDGVFNTAFTCFVVGILFSRFIFVLSHPKWGYLNPLVFFLFPYFPGLSLSGGVVGVMFFILFMTKAKKMPSGRILDMFSLALYPATIVTMIAMNIGDILMKYKIFLGDVSIIISFTLIYVLYALGFAKTKWREGLIATWLLLIYSLGFLIHDSFLLKFNVLSLLQQDVLFLFLFLFNVFLITQERLVREK